MIKVAGIATAKRAVILNGLPNIQTNMKPHKDISNVGSVEKICLLLTSRIIKIAMMSFNPIAEIASSNI